MTLQQLNFPLVPNYDGDDLISIDYTYYMTSETWLFESEEWEFDLYYDDFKFLRCLIDLNKVVYGSDDSKTLLEQFFTNDTRTT